MTPSPRRARAIFWQWFIGLPFLAIGLIVVGLLAEGYTIYLSGQRQLSQLELALSQLITLLLSLYGSYVVGRRSAEAAAMEVVRPHGKKAFRRLLSLYYGLGRIQTSIADRRTFLLSVADAASATVPMSHVQSQLDLLAAQVAEQLGTADDSLEDWRDIVPEDVAALERQAKEKIQGEARA